VAILCVALSLALFALCSADPTDRFCLRTLNFGRPMPIVGPILDIVVVFRNVVGMMCEESGRRANVYNAFYYVLQGSVALPPRL
jgi:hypothetical protein